MKLSIFNLDTMYNALIEVDLGKYNKEKRGQHFYQRTIDNKASELVSMPEDNDWGGYWYSNYYLLDTIIDIFKLDKNITDNLKAKKYAKLHFKYLDNMSNRTIKGKYFLDNENDFASGETYMMQSLCKAYLLRIIFE